MREYANVVDKMLIDLQCYSHACCLIFLTLRSLLEIKQIKWQYRIK